MLRPHRLGKFLPCERFKGPVSHTKHPAQGPGNDDDYCIINVITTIMGVIIKSLLKYRGNILITENCIQRKHYVYHSSCRVLQQITADMMLLLFYSPKCLGLIYIQIFNCGNEQSNKERWVELVSLEPRKWKQFNPITRMYVRSVGFHKLQVCPNFTCCNFIGYIFYFILPQYCVYGLVRFRHKTIFFKYLDLSPWTLEMSDFVARNTAENVLTSHQNV